MIMIAFREAFPKNDMVEVLELAIWNLFEPI